MNFQHPLKELWDPIRCLDTFNAQSPIQITPSYMLVDGYATESPLYNVERDSHYLEYIVPGNGSGSDFYSSNQLEIFNVPAIESSSIELCPNDLLVQVPTPLSIFPLNGTSYLASDVAIYLKADQVAERELLRHCLFSEWLRNDWMEPNVAPKRSILLGFLSYEPDKNKENTHVCKFDQCGKSFDRQDRALGHIRMHLNHRPYHCNGQCHVSGCQDRFSARAYLQGHIKREKRNCTTCGRSICRQNLRRHQASCSSSSTSSSKLTKRPKH